MPKWNNKWKGAQRKFDSKFEEELHLGVLRDCEYHTKDRYHYTICHKYEPDFVWTDGTYTYLIEAKGRFHDSTEAAKYVHIRASLDPWTELVFLFYNPETPFPNAKVRKKCGTKRTHSEWAEKNEFSWFTKDTIWRLLNDSKDIH